jgi:hypothetical protein
MKTAKAILLVYTFLIAALCTQDINWAWFVVIPFTIAYVFDKILTYKRD